MFNQFKFAETEFWEKAILSTYPLKKKIITIGKEQINIYSVNDYFSNCPYITDGGYYDETCQIIKKNLNNITKPILIKTRSKLNISPEINYFLDKENFTFILPLDKGKEYVWNNLIKSKTRNQVRKAEKSNYICKIGNIELLDDFYFIISTAWRDLGTPTHSKLFYNNILENLNNEFYKSNVIILYINNEPASAALIIYDEISLHHPYAATIKKYNHLSLNNALYWNIIQFGIEKNLKYFDLGRSKENQSTAKFKKSWGATPVPLYYYYLNKNTHKNSENNKIIQLLISIWKKLPLRIANFIGPKLIYKVLK